MTEILSAGYISELSRSLYSRDGDFGISKKVRRVGLVKLRKEGGLVRI